MTKHQNFLYIENNEIIFGVQRKIGQHLKNSRVLYFKTKKDLICYHIPESV